MVPNNADNVKPSIADYLKKCKITYYEEKYHFYRVNCKKSILRYFMNIPHYIHLIYKIRNIKYDLVHSNSSFTDLGAWIGIIRRIPHIWHLREFGNWDNSYPAMGKCYDRFLTSRVTRGIAISKCQFKFFLPLFPKDKLEVIYDGVEVVPYDTAKKTHIPVFRICLVGNLCEGKNQILSLQAAKILKQRNIAFKLYLIGREGPYKSVLENYINDNHLKEYVEITGEVNDVDKRLYDMDCGLTLTNNEAFGLVTVEYMLHKLPVIVTCSGANPELVTDGLNGYILSKNSPEELANYINIIINDRLAGQKMGENGYQRAICNFTAEKNAEKIAELYFEITS